MTLGILVAIAVVIAINAWVLAYVANRRVDRLASEVRRLKGGEL